MTCECFNLDNFNIGQSFNRQNLPFQIKWCRQQQSSECTARPTRRVKLPVKKTRLRVQLWSPGRLLLRRRQPRLPAAAAEAHTGGPPAQPAADTRCKLLLLRRRQLLLPSQRRMMTNRHSRKNEVMKNTHSPKIRLDDIQLCIHPPLL